MHMSARGFVSLWVLAGLLVVLAGGFFLTAYISPDRNGGPVACTADAMQCPDGSYVGRTGPNCEFVCPPADPAGGGGGGILPYNSGIKGVILLGPMCPVERMPPDPACADRPYETSVAVFRASDPARAIVLTRSDAKGRFEASLSPGEYIVAAGEGTMLPSCGNISVTVPPSAYATITIDCDSGIR